MNTVFYSWRISFWNNSPRLEHILNNFLGDSFENIQIQQATQESLNSSDNILKKNPNIKLNIKFCKIKESQLDDSKCAICLSSSVIIIIPYDVIRLI